MTDEKRLTKEKRAKYREELDADHNSASWFWWTALLDECDALEADLLAANLRADNAENVARTAMAELSAYRTAGGGAVLDSYNCEVGQAFHGAKPCGECGTCQRDEARTTAREFRDKYEPGKRLAWEDGI